MDIVVGNVVKGEDLYGRARELQYLWEVVKKSSLMLDAPRRYGKTSIVSYMKDNPYQGWSVTYIDMEGFEHPYEFITELLDHVESNILQNLKNIFRDVRNNTESVNFVNTFAIALRTPDRDWKKEGIKVFQELIKNNPQQIVIIDELPIYLRKIQDKYQDDGRTISAFLYWLRKIRHDLQIRFIVCGSIGIHTLVDKYDLGSSINDLTKVHLQPFDSETAKGMITEVLNNYHISHTEDLVNQIIDEIGLPVPFFIQLMLSQIRDRTEYGKEKLTSEIIVDSYNQGLLGVEGKRDFEWYFKQLKKEFEGKNFSIASEILKHLTEVSSATEAELENIYKKIKRQENKPEFKQILSSLKSGYYIEINEDGITFHNKVLRDLWIQEGGVRY